MKSWILVLSLKFFLAVIYLKFPPPQQHTYLLLMHILILLDHTITSKGEGGGFRVVDGLKLVKVEKTQRYLEDSQGINLQKEMWIHVQVIQRRYHQISERK